MSTLNKAPLLNDLAIKLSERGTIVKYLAVTFTLNETPLINDFSNKV